LEIYSRQSDERALNTNVESEAVLSSLVYLTPVKRLNYPMKIMTITRECQLIVLQPEGRLDLQRGKILEQQLTGLVPQRQALWVIDLAKVDFMDSSGLVALITGLKAARKCDCRLVLCNVQAPVQLIFELTRLDSVFEIFESYDVLLSAVKAPVLAA